MKSYSIEELNKIAHSTIKLMKKDFTFEDGSFFLEKDGEKIFNTNIFADIGDYLPFFMYFGERDFIKLHIDLVKKKMKSGLLVSDLPTFGLNNLVKTYEYTDFLLGLIDYYDFDKDEETKKWVESSIDKSIRIFNLKSNSCSFFYEPLKIKIPILDTRDGTLIETYIDAYNHFEKEEYLYVAKNIYQRLIETDSFKKNGILTDFESSSFMKSIFNLIKSNKFTNITICKNNTNTLFGFLSLYKQTKDDSIILNINKIINRIKADALVDGGGISKNLMFNIKPDEAFLTASFSMLDFLCDAYIEIKDLDYLKFAEDIANFWINKQGQTGLFPVFSNEKETFLDSETDMCIALLKLYEITNDEKYKISADKCFNGIIEYHVKNNFVLGIDINNGDVLNIIQRTKFIGLFLKLIILKISYLEGDLIYEKTELHSLLRDR